MLAFSWLEPGVGLITKGCTDIAYPAVRPISKLASVIASVLVWRATFWKPLLKQHSNLLHVAIGCVLRHLGYFLSLVLIFSANANKVLYILVLQLPHL